MVSLSIKYTDETTDTVTDVIEYIMNDRKLIYKKVVGYKKVTIIIDQSDINYVTVTNTTEGD